MMHKTLFTRTLGWCASLVLGLGLGLGLGVARAQDYPQRPITIVVPFGTGNIADNQGRMIARYLENALGQPVVVENKPGAGGSIGTAQVARARPDGYTLLYGTHGTQAANAALYPKGSVDPAHDLRAVHSLFRQSTVLVVPASRPWRTLQEMLDAARKTPGGLSYASSGIGTQTHLAAAKFQSATHVNLTHVPYSGKSSMTDLLAGTIDLTFSYAESVMPHIAAGSLRALAINGKSRMEALPDVPTVGELGFPDAALEGWSGVFVPRGTPDAIVARLAREIAKGTEAADVKSAMAKIGSYPMGLADGAFQAFVESEVVRWRDIVKTADADAR
ncbi:MAG TPA: tripartite tricarboxylate transporter substrate binding protein [Rubrivivax sp.]|nr:tripartite tricarboxylate transporter substrate binding protein [Rubrivivax sp.]